MSTLVYVVQACFLKSWMLDSIDINSCFQTGELLMCLYLIYFSYVIVHLAIVLFDGKIASIIA